MTPVESRFAHTARGFRKNSGRQRVAVYNGKPLDPPIQGKANLGISQIFQVGTTEVALIEDEGAEVCPAKFYIVSISPAGLKETSAFGTCTDLVEIKQDTDTISISMPGFAGPFNSKAAQAKARKEKHVFIYKLGILTDNGKEIK